MSDNSQVSLRARCLLYGYFLCLAATANAEPQEVVAVTGEAISGELVSISAERAMFRVSQTEVPAPTRLGSPRSVATSPTGIMRSVGLDELARWGHPAPLRPQTLVVLADGGRLVAAADWSGGAPVRLEGDALIVLSDTFGERRIPRVVVRGVVFAQQSHPAERERLVERVETGVGRSPDASSPDVVWLTTKDRLTGKLTQLSRGSLTIATQSGAARLPLSRVEAVRLGNRGRTAAHSPDLSLKERGNFVVGLRDGSLLYVNEIHANEAQLVLEIGDTVKLAGGNVDDIASMQSLAGRFIYLSDLEPADYRHVPYLSIEWPYRPDRCVTGEPLTVRGKRYLKGIGMHSASRLTYPLEGTYRAFDAAVALDDSAGKRGSVTFGVHLLRNGKWQTAYTSEVVRGSEAPVPVSVDVRGADGLTLTVDFADRGDEMDRADWLDARLIKN